MKIAHKPTVASLLLVWMTAVIWLWPHAVRAGTLSADLRVYDWVSLEFAAGLGLLGGFLALIVALATDKRVVMEVFKESLRNMLVSPIAGMAMYLLLDTLAGFGYVTLPPVGRFMGIVGSGWAGIAFFIWVRGVVTRNADKVGDEIAGKVKL